MRVLVVEDESALSAQLASALSEAGYVVDCAADGDRADFLGQTEVYDAVVLDLGLPKVDGLTVLRRWREARVGVPVLVLTARDSWHEKVRGIDSGADDYVAKPFRMEELLARLRAALRHRLQQQGERPVFRSGELSVDLVRRVVRVRGEEVKLSPREYDLLRLLVAHAGKVLTHKFILREVWGGETDIQYLRIYIRSLRQKIEPDPERPRHLVTETGVGYRLRLSD